MDKIWYGNTCGKGAYFQGSAASQSQGDRAPTYPKSWRTPYLLTNGLIPRATKFGIITHVRVTCFLGSATTPSWGVGPQCPPNFGTSYNLMRAYSMRNVKKFWILIKLDVIKIFTGWTTNADARDLFAVADLVRNILTDFFLTACWGAAARLFNLLPLPRPL